MAVADIFIYRTINSDLKFSITDMNSKTAYSKSRFKVVITKSIFDFWLSNPSNRSNNQITGFHAAVVKSRLVELELTYKKSIRKDRVLLTHSKVMKYKEICSQCDCTIFNCGNVPS